MMTELTTKTVYFSQPGRGATDRALELARERATALGIDTLLIATTSGATAVRAAELLPELNIIAVTHSTGFREPDMQDLTAAHRTALEAAGVQLLTCQHAFGGVGRAIRRQLNTYQSNEIIANTFRLFGQGMKVAAEIALMAADAGAVSVQQPVIAVAGTGKGADTVVILQPTNAAAFFDLKIMEIACMPAPQHPAFG